MTFINPIEILELTAYEISAIDNAVIKKSKRKLFVNIDLSDDGLYSYKGKEITKSDCERAIDELSDADILHHYHFIANNQLLNNFLAIGDTKIFYPFKQESIYKLHTFIDFISPYFAEQFNKALLTAFKTNNTSLFSDVLKSQIFINHNAKDDAFQGLLNEIKNRIIEIDEIKIEIKKGNLDFTSNDFAKPLYIVKSNFPIELLNVLPKQFQSLINNAAESINYMQLQMGDVYSTKIEILSHINRLQIDSISKKTISDNYVIAKRRYEEKLEQEKNAPILKKWSFILKQVDNNIDEIDNKKTKPAAIEKNIFSIVNIAELNELPDFGNEIRNQIAYSLRNLAISSWNIQSDLETAIIFINLALKIDSSTGTKGKILNDAKDLMDILKQREVRGKPVTYTPSLRTINGIGSTIYGDTQYFVLLMIPIIPISRWNCERTFGGYRFYGQLKLRLWQKTWLYSVIGTALLGIAIALFQSNNVLSNTDTSIPNTQSSSSAVLPSTNLSIDSSSENVAVEPMYNTVNMKNGNIPGCLDFEPKYDYNIDNKLIISAELTDAAVKIIDSETDKCIRFVFIKDGATYIVRNIPEGKYYLKIAYGNNWSVRDNAPICKGHFISQALYKKDDDLYDFNKKEYDDGRISIPSYTLKLYTTYTLGDKGGASPPNSISEDDFYKK